MPQMPQRDLIIVGSGPAGLATGLHLVQQAPELAQRTLILEKARHPRPKLCAGGLLPDSVVRLELLGLDVTEVPHVKVPWANFTFQGRGMRMTANNRDYAFYVIRRHEFDAWLASKARERGLTLQEETKVLSVRHDGNGVIVETNRGDFYARAVVGADGANSVVRRAVQPESARNVARLLEVLVHPRNGDAPKDHPAHLPDEAYFEFGCLPYDIQGYVWDFPTQEDGAPRRCWGIYDSRVDARGDKGDLPNTLNEFMARYGYTPEDYTLQAHPIRWFDARATFSAPGILLAGDAAGVDAAFGEGVSPALGYGEIAANAVVDAFAREDFSFRDYRKRVLGHSLGRALRTRTFTAKVLFSLRQPGIQRLLWWRFSGFLNWYINRFVINWTER